MSQQGNPKSLLIDSNEANTPMGGKVKSFFASHLPHIHLLVKQTVADYVFQSEDGLICVERTNLEDLHNKVVSGRVYEQVISERQACYRLYYVIAGYSEVYAYLRRHGQDALFVLEGTLTAIGKFGAIVVPLWFANTFPNWLARVFQKEAMGRISKPPARIQHKKIREPCEIAVDVLTALPGIGHAKAKQILRAKGNLKAVLDMLANNPRALAVFVREADLERIIRALLEPCDTA